MLRVDAIDGCLPKDRRAKVKKDLHSPDPNSMYSSNLLAAIVVTRPQEEMNKKNHNWFPNTYL